MNITINLPEGKEVTVTPELDTEDVAESMVQAILAAQLLYPNWTSLVVTVIRP